MPSSLGWCRPEELVENLSSVDAGAKLKALRDVKNQIIGNKTKKLSYIKLGAVPRVVEILASESEAPLLVQSAAAVGSFACGIELGVKTVLDSGALPHLLRMLCNGDEQVVEAGARSLKMIFQSALAPKNDMLQGQRMDLLLTLLNSTNENVAEFAASVIARCCETSLQQQSLLNAGALDILLDLLGSSLKRREACLDVLRALVKDNPQISMKLINVKQGGALATIIKFVKDKSPRTRLLACMCLANVSCACPSSYSQEWEVRTDMLPILVKLLDEPGQVGEEAPSVLADLVANNEELQKLVYPINAVEKLCNLLHKDFLQPNHLQGVLVALSELGSRLEDSRRKILSFEPQGPIAAALVHESMGVRIAACNCIKNISRSVKNLRTSLTDEGVVFPLFKLLDDESPAVQVAALSAISNVVLDFTPHKTVFFKCGGVMQLIQLAKSMDPLLRLNAVWALRNLLYLADMSVKRKVMEELTVATLISLIHDPEEVVQEQALAFVRNLVYGSVESVQQIFVEDGIILRAVVQQLRVATGPEVCTQGLYVLCNVAAGNEFHKDEVMHFVVASLQEACIPLNRFLQDMNNSQLRVAAVWCIMNLSYPDSPGVLYRIDRLINAGFLLHLQNMTDDPCLDVKDRVKTAMEQFMAAEISL